MQSLTHSFLSWLLITMITASTIEAEKIVNNFGDLRCRCTCPTTSGRKVFKQAIAKFEECDCVRLLTPLMSDAEVYCRTCTCISEERNTTYMMVVVILVIFAVIVLAVYMVYLEYRDPLLNCRETGPIIETTHKVTPHSEPEEELEESRSRSQQLYKQMSKHISKVKDNQEKWRDTVQEQRARIYDRHTLLN